MAVTQAQKVDFLLKKIGFTKTKTGLAVDETLSGTKKAGFAEAIPSPLIIANDSLWNESSSIPATPPGSDTAQVKVYLASTSGHQMTVDSTVADNRAFIAFSTYNNTSSARLNNWIDTQFGASYLIKVFRGDPNSGGVQLSAAGSGNNDGWFFDYSAGVLNFNDTNVPSGVTSSNIYIVGYRYIGLTGAPTPTGGGNFSFNDLTVTNNLSVGGISTFTGLIDANGGITATTGTFEDLFGGGAIVFSTGSGKLDDSANLSYSIGSNTLNVVNIIAQGNQQLDGNLDVGKDLDVDGHTDLDNVSISGISTFSGIIDAVNTPASIRVAQDIQHKGDADTKISFPSADTITFDTAGTERIRIDSNGVKVSNLISGRVVLAGTSGKLEDSNNLTFDGTTLGLTGNANFTGNLTVGGVLTYEDVKNVDSVGLITARSGIRVTSGVIEAQAGENKIPFLYSNLAALPNAGTYHGMFAHVHSEGRGYFAHAGNWLELVNKDTSGNVGLSGDLDVDGHTNLDNVSIAGVTTHSGSTTFDQNITFNGSSNGANWIKSGDKFRLNDNSKVNFGSGDNMQVYHTGSAGYITNNTGAINISGNVNIEDDLDVDGHTELDNVRISGITTTQSIQLGSSRLLFAHSGGTASDHQIWNDGSDLRMYSSSTTGIRIQTNAAGGNNSDLKLQTDTIDALVVKGTGEIEIAKDLDVDGHTNLDNVSVAGVTTFASNVSVGSSIAVGTGVTVETNGQATFTGIVTASSFRGDGSQLTGISVDATALKDSNGNVKIQANESGAVHVGISTFQDIDVDGHTNLDNVSVAGITTFNEGLFIPDTKELKIGNSASNPDLKIWNNTASTIIREENSNLDIQASFLRIADTSGNYKLMTNGTGVSIPENLTVSRDFDVDGHTNLDNVSVAGVTTFTGNARFDSTITAGGATGSNGQYLKSTGTGVAWESFPTMRTTTTVTASAGQTTFSFSYNVGFLDVFINGTKLTDSEFTATNGTSVVLAVGCFVGDIVDLISYNTVSGGGGGGGGSSITVQDEGSSLSTDATVLNFVGTGVVASGTGATKTITINAGTGDTSNVRTNTLEVVGVTTFASSVNLGDNDRLNFYNTNTSIRGTNQALTLDAAGGKNIKMVTNSGGGSTGDIILNGGTSGDLLTVHGTGDVDITNTLGIGGSITKASGQLDIRADNLQLKNAASGATYASFTNGGAAELNHNNTKRLETTSSGVNVIGSLFVNGSAIGGGGGGSSLFSQTVAGIHTLSKVGIGTADPEFDLDLGSYISSGVSVASTIRIIGENNSTAIRIGPGGTNNDITIIRVDSKDGTTDGDTFTDLGHSIKYMGSGSGVENRLAFWVDNTNKTKYEALSIYNNGFIGINYNLGFNGVPPTDHFTVENGTSKFDAVRVVGVSTFQNVLPQTDSTYDIGTNTVRFRNIYADNLYGDGTNITGISGGGGTDVGITTNLSGSFSATPGSPTTINTLSGYSSDDLVVEYTIYIKNGSNIQTQKLLAMRDGTTIDSTQFAVMFSSSLLAQFDATISSGNILLRATPESGITGTTDYKIKREVM